MTTTPNSIISAQQAKNGHVQIANADGQTQKVAYTADTNGDLVLGFALQSTDTVDRDVQISITNAGTSYPLGTVTVPAGAGNSGTVPNVDGFAAIQGLPHDQNGNPYLFLMSGDTLTVSALSTVTSGKLITANAIAVGAF